MSDLEKKYLAEIEVLQGRIVTLQQEMVRLKTAMDQWSVHGRIYQMVAQHLADLVALVDLSGKRIWNNETFSQTLGYVPEELKQGDSFAQIHPQDQERVKHIFEETLKTGVGRRADYRMLHKSGSWIPLESNAEVVRNAGGNPEYLVIVSRDVSKRRELEAEIVKTARSEGVQEMVRHVLKNLKIVLGLQELFLKENEGVRAKAESSLGIAEHMVRSFVQLLQRFPGQSSKPQPILLETFLVPLADQFLQSSSLRPEYWFAKDLDAVNVETSGLAIALEEIIRNAREATRGKGILRIEATNFVYDPSTSPQALHLLPGRYVLLEIRDSGLGIKAENLPKIFHPFFTTKESAKGLGLTTALAITQSWGGTIQVDSEEEKGTTVSLFIPAVEITAPVVQTGPIPEKAKAPARKILFMDDQVLILQFVQEVLQMKGHSVVTCTEGGLAVKLYEEGKKAGSPFDFVILDLVVPEGLGAVETLDLLKKIDANVTCIVSSGKTHHPAMSHWRDYGFSGALEKPYDAERIDALITKLSRKCEAPQVL